MKQRANLRSPLFLQYASRPAEAEAENLQVYSEEFDNAVWTKTRTTITANQELAPDGTNTADKLTGDGTGTSYAYDGVSFTSGLEYAISIFVKPINVTTFVIQNFTEFGTATFDIQNGTLSGVSGSLTSQNIENYGNGWYRCSAIYSCTSTGSKNVGYGIQNYNGDQFYLWGAQVEEGNETTSYIKTEATTVTRAATEPQVVDVTAELRIYNGRGGYDYERTNLQTYSEQFDNSVWSKVNSSITADDTLAPDGTLTADKLTATAASLSTYVYEQHNLSTDTAYSMSVFVKKGTSNLVRIDLEDFTSGTQGRMTFNLNTQEITSTIGAASYEDSGNGWYRLIVNFTTSSTLGIHYLRIWDFETVNNAYFYLWGAQLEEAAQATSYIKTEATAVTELAYQTEAPTEATYTLTRTPNNAKTTFEVSELVRDYIEQTTENTSGTTWLEVTLSDSVQLPKHYHFLCTEGYIDNTEGLQTYLNAPSNETFMQSNSTILIPEGEYLEVPVNAQFGSFYTITTGGVEGSAQFFSNLDSNETQIEYITVKSTDEVVKLYVNNVTTEEITIQETECSKFANNKLLFVNKHGAKQEFYVNMKSIEKIRVKSDGFNRNVINYDTLSIEGGKHSYKRRVNEARESYTLNTPFLNEDNVEAFEELLLSEYVWYKKEGGSYIPVMIKDSSMTRKTHLNDKLIQYTIQVESADQLINTIR